MKEKTPGEGDSSTQLAPVKEVRENRKGSDLKSEKSPNPS
jgi:hypothetical protein